MKPALRHTLILLCAFGLVVPGTLASGTGRSLAQLSGTTNPLVEQASSLVGQVGRLPCSCLRRPSDYVLTVFVRLPDVCDGMPEPVQPTHGLVTRILWFESVREARSQLTNHWSELQLLGQNCFPIGGRPR